MNFNVGDNIIYKNYDVCCVEAVEKPDFVKHTDSIYYKLKSVFSSSNGTIYVPVDAQEHMRYIISAEKANEYIQLYKTLSPEICNAKQNSVLQEHYNEIYTRDTTEAFLLLIKEILIKEREAKSGNRSLRQIDTKYLELTEKPASEEFALALNKTPDEIKKFFREEAL